MPGDTTPGVPALIKRLRELDMIYSNILIVRSLMDDAADALGTQAAEIARLRAELTSLKVSGKE